MIGGLESRLTEAHKDSVATSAKQIQPTAWGLSARGIAVRLFITCWAIYALHFATNTVREIYPALALGDHFSFRVDEYANMHPDLFEKEGYGWHIGNNPGASMLAAIPYALARPVIDRLVEREQKKRAASGLTEPPSYNSNWPMAREFYSEAWRRGLDIKFGLAAFVMQSMCMAPISALGAVVMFYVLTCIYGSRKTALWLALLFAFGTPVFFRTGYLNQNLMLGYFAFMGFVAMWNPGSSSRWSSRTRYFLGGLAGGTALLFDYSGVIFLLGLFVYGVFKRVRTASGETFRHACWYVMGTLGPIALLWLYQWRSFGNPFYPGQHWMPPVEWIERGYRGFGGPQFELLMSLAFDYRYGLFMSSPLILLAILAPVVNRRSRRLPGLEMATLLVLFIGLWVFFSGSNYTRLQFNTGIRYMSPILPFLFIPASIALMRLPRLAIYFVAVFSLTESWCLAMYRDVESGLGLLDPILHVLLGGFRLPALTTLSNMGGQYGDFFKNGASPLPLFALAGAILYAIWTARRANDSSMGYPESRRLKARSARLGEAVHAGAMSASQGSSLARQVSVDVVIPVLNEAHVLQKSIITVRGFLQRHPFYKWRIMVVDNGSTDGTDKVAKGLSEQFSDVAFLQLVHRGRGRALRYAWMQSKADIVCYMDVDLSTDLEHLPDLIGAIANEGFDIATGSRLMQASQISRSKRREFISRIYNIFIQAVLFTRFSDAQCGFKAVSREVVDQIVPQIEDQSWFFDTELLVLAEKQGYLIKDIPVAWSEDDDSRVKILRTAWDDIKGVLRLRKQLWTPELAPASVTGVKREKS